MPTRWTRVARRIVAMCTERLPYKAVALFFALVLWVAASGEELGAHYVPVRFTAVLDGSVRIVGQPPAMRALVAGPTHELLKLYAVPPVVRHSFGTGTPDTMRLVLNPHDVELPAGVEHVTVRDIAPHTIVLRFASGPQTVARAAAR